MADESFRRVYTGFSAALIAAGAFALILWGLARFMPVFLNFTNSRWRYLLPAFAGLMISINGLIRLIKAKRRAV